MFQWNGWNGPKAWFLPLERIAGFPVATVNAEGTVAIDGAGVTDPRTLYMSGVAYGNATAFQDYGYIGAFAVGPYSRIVFRTSAAGSDNRFGARADIETDTNNVSVFEESYDVTHGVCAAIEDANTTYVVRTDDGSFATQVLDGSDWVGEDTMTLAAPTASGECFFVSLFYATHDEATQEALCVWHRYYNRK